MTEILPSRSGLVHLSQVEPLSPLVCPHTSSSIRVGCHGGDADEAASVHLYPNHSAPGSCSQGTPGRSMPATCSSIWVSSGVVFRPSLTPERLSLEDSDQEGEKKKSTINESNTLVIKRPSVDCSRPMAKTLIFFINQELLLNKGIHYIWKGNYIYSCLLLKKIIKCIL